MLSRLKEINRHLTFVDPDSDAFAEYGRSLQAAGWKELAGRAARLIPPELPPAYLASVPELEQVPPPAALNGIFRGEDPQVGICRGFNSALNGMEWHDSAEVIVAVSPLILLLGKQAEIDGGEWNSRHARACFLRAGEAVMLNPGTLHFAPCRTDEYPFLSLIVLPRGVNGDLASGEGEDPEESADPILWKHRKWLLAHPDSPQAEKGAPVGINGPNLQVHTL